MSGDVHVRFCERRGVKFPPATHLVVGFEHKRDALVFQAELRERFAKFGLELHPDKTRILEFGRYAANNRARRGEGNPETFDFLGFTHICGKTRNGRFTVRRQTMAKRLRAKLSEVKTELRRRMTEPIPEQGKYLRAVLTGHVRYYGCPATGQRCSASVNSSAGIGAELSGDVATATRQPGNAFTATSPAGSHPRASATPGLRSGLASSPKAGARCGNTARRDLWRGL